MEKLVRRLARQMFDKGLSLPDAQVAIGMLEREEQFLQMEKEISKKETLDRRTAWGIAAEIADPA